MRTINTRRHQSGLFRSALRAPFAMLCAALFTASLANAEEAPATDPAAVAPAPADSMLSGEQAGRWSVAGGSELSFGWLLRDGELLANPIATEEPEVPPDLDWPEPVGDFELSFEFQIQRMGWGGIEYRMPESSGRPLRGLFFCICDDAHHPLSGVGRLGNRSTGALFDVLGPAPSTVVRPLGEWNQARIVARGTIIEHWINGMRALHTDTSRPEFEALTAGSIFRDTPRYGQLPAGRLRLLRGDGRIAYRHMTLRAPAPAEPPKPDATSTETPPPAT
ncbi:MAG: DUF1080 domain-containing protein [Kiritimatiellae bacterium]|nr:DUF1080 domain-containing protein [Kiritimatiellia bacterium]